MALYQYFQPSDGLPDPSGPLSASVSPAVIKDANEAVRSATRSKPRGKYAKFTPKQQPAIGKYMPHCMATRQLSIIFKEVGSRDDYFGSGAYENKNTKISSEGLTAVYMKICICTKQAGPNCISRSMGNVDTGVREGKLYYLRYA